MRIGSYSLAGRFVQSAAANRRRLINAAGWLEDGETITSVTYTVDNTTSPVLTVSQIVIGPDGDRFAYYVSGGVEGEEYTISFTITTSAAQVRVDEIQVAIVEVKRG